MKRKAKIYYVALDDFWRKEEKLEWIRENPISQIPFERIEPDEKHNWINQTDNDWDSLLPLIDKDVKAGKSEEAVFKSFSRGVETGRDEWVYDLSKEDLEKKIKYFTGSYNKSIRTNTKDYSIKWNSSLDEYFNSKYRIEFDISLIKDSTYRPYYKMFHYADRKLNHRLTVNHYDIFGEDLDRQNQIIAIPGLASPKPFHTLGFQNNFDFNALPAGSQSLPRFTYLLNNSTNSVEKHENITDWALNQFQTHYKESNGATITKEDIFFYVYAALHSPQYRKKYEQNLKREFPRLPFYDDFFQWRDWGKELMDLHINYETVEPFAFERKDLNSTPNRKIKQENLFGGKKETENEIFIPAPKTKLRADKTQGAIEIDSHTTLTGVPPLAWEYKLGNRSALEWILDQYKERKPKDATIAERFNNYKFEDYKEHVIDLLGKVTTVSVKTMEIINRMPEE